MQIEVFSIDNAPALDNMRPYLTAKEWEYCTKSNFKELNRARTFLTYKTKELLKDFSIEISRENSRPFIDRLYNLGYSHKNKLLGIVIAPYPQNIAIDIEDLTQDINWSLFYNHCFTTSEVEISKMDEKLYPYIIFASKEVVMKIETRSLDLRQIEVLEIDSNHNIIVSFQQYRYELTYKIVDYHYIVVNGQKVI